MRQNMKSVCMITLALIQFACAAATAQQQQPPPRKELTEVRFTVAEARVEQFPRPLPRRNGEPYREALVVRIVASRAELDALAPSLEPYLYFGTLELRPWDFRHNDDGRTAVLTFHLPEWQQLREPVPMVLTTERGEPQRNPRRYVEYPRFDPGRIKR